MRRSLRMGRFPRNGSRGWRPRAASGSHCQFPGTAPRQTGFVLVFDDLTEVLRAQKSAAWQEVARRIAHEIKNPLTPIQLSAQRFAGNSIAATGTAEPPKDAELMRNRPGMRHA